MFGGGAACRPGEASLAHGGVLFLDEAPEFSRRVLAGLQAIRLAGRVALRRQPWGAIELPANHLLIGAALPCACGWSGSARPCVCTDASWVRWDRRLADLRALFDDVVYLKTPSARDLTAPGPFSTDALRARIAQAREESSR